MTKRCQRSPALALPSLWLPVPVGARVFELFSKGKSVPDGKFLSLEIVEKLDKTIQSLPKSEFGRRARLAAVPGNHLAGTEASRRDSLRQRLLPGNRHPLPSHSKGSASN